MAQTEQLNNTGMETRRKTGMEHQPHRDNHKNVPRKGSKNVHENEVT